jgi:xylan 1,4-beta-xylosidase
MTLHGIPKPSYRAFQLLHRLGTELVTPVDGMHANVSVWAVRGTGRATLLALNSAPPDQDLVAARVAVHLATTASVRGATIERIDDTHANPKRRWLELGAPEYLQPVQVAELDAASGLRPDPHPITRDEAGIQVSLDLPANGVAAVTIELADPSVGRHG